VPAAGVVIGGLLEADVLLLLTSLIVASGLRLVPAVALEPSLSENLGIFVNDNGFLAAEATTEVALLGANVGVADFGARLEDDILPMYIISIVATFDRT